MKQTFYFHEILNISFIYVEYSQNPIKEKIVIILWGIIYVFPGRCISQVVRCKFFPIISEIGLCLNNQWSLKTTIGHKQSQLSGITYM